VLEDKLWLSSIPGLSRLLLILTKMNWEGKTLIGAGKKEEKDIECRPVLQRNRTREKSDKGKL